MKTGIKSLEESRPSWWMVMFAVVGSAERTSDSPVWRFRDRCGANDAEICARIRWPRAKRMLVMSAGRRSSYDCPGVSN